MIKEIDIKKPHQGVIGILESVLEKAKSGEVQSIAIAGINDDCNPFNCFGGEFYPVHLIGELRLLERDLVDLCCDIRKEVSWDYVE